MEAFFNIDSLAEETFDFEETISYTKELLDNFNAQSEHTKCAFESDEWHVYENTRKSSLYFRFEELNSYSSNPYVSIEPKTYMKCWVAERLNESSVPHAHASYNSVMKVIELTNFFETNKVEDLIYHIEHELAYVEDTKIRYIHAILNFLSYAEELDQEGNYTRELTHLRSKMKTSDVVRTLPNSQDILKFSWSVNHFVESNKMVNEEEVLEWLRFFPVVLWWKLTSVIPIRASEFCSIKRDCLLSEAEEHWIVLPRKKQSKAKTVKLLPVEDKIKITKEIHDLINTYIDLTHSYGESDTLISYSSLLSNGMGNAAKKNKKAFSLNNFRTLLDSFYATHVSSDHINSPVSDRLKPNDTRHLAFLSLMMQGVHPVEIARLGGHSDIKAQYHYHQHQEYWVDSEVEKLMSSFDLQGSSLQLNKEKELQSTTLDTRFKLLAMLKSPVEQTHKKLEIGYCTDEHQRCETECFFCPYWKISKEEFDEKASIIDEKHKALLSNINDLSSFLQNVHRSIMADDMNKFQPIYAQQLQTTSKKIKDEIYKLAKVNFIEEGGAND